jgi:RimJ/RimL family protein N-acetyltransferase
MRHSIHLAGAGFALRPVTEADAAFIVQLRTDPVLSRFVNDTPADPAVQVEWIRRYFERPGDYGFIVENVFTGAAEGTISIYNQDTERNEAEWGRWILRAGSLGASESVALVYRIAFVRLGLSSLDSHTIVENHHVMNFHASCGLELVAELPDHCTIGGRHYDAARHRITAENWPAIDVQLGETVARAARLAERNAGK